MIHDLITLARARESQIRQQANGHQRLPRLPRLPRPPRNRRSRVSALVRRATCRLGSWMVTVGRRLECYDFRMVGETDTVTG